MKIAIIGPGAIGLLFAGFLKKSNQDVILIDKYPHRAKKITKQGIRIEGISGKHRIGISATSHKNILKDADLVILCVKSYDTESAVRGIKSFVNKKALFLTMQNGIGNVEIIQKYIKKDRIVAGITAQGATLLDIGHIRHAGKGEIVIGRIDGKISREVKEIACIFKKAGFETAVTGKINNFLWSKLIVNAGINALTAITRMKNGKLIEFKETRDILRQAVEEAVLVAKKKKIKIIYADPVKKVESVCKATRNNVSSMLQDVLKKRKTEIDYINGAVVKHAKKAGIEVPFNEELTNLVKVLESPH